MKTYLKCIGISSLAIFLAGCASSTHHATARRNVDVGAAQGSKGTVEFHSQTDGAVVPIYHVNEDGSKHLLSGVGLKEGSRYNFDRSGVVVAERLNVIAPTGQQQFQIDGSGPQIKVNVAEGKTTPVVIGYELLERGEAFVIYRADAHVQHPIESKKE